MGVSIHFDGNSISADLSRLVHIVPEKLTQAVQQTALRTKKEWQSDARGAFGRKGGQYAPTIDYDMKSRWSKRGTIQAEVGPDLSRYRGGGLVPSWGLLEEASGRIRSGARGSIFVAAMFAAEELEKGIGIAVEQSERATGF